MSGNLHGMAAFGMVISGPLSAIVAYKLETKPLAYFSVVIGAFALLDLFLSMTMHGSSPFSVFDRGGTERMAAYPLLIWIIGFGGYLMGT
jgi:hypothetical protein